MKFLFFLFISLNSLFAQPFIPKDVNDVIFIVEQDEVSKKMALLLKKIEKEPRNLVLVDNLLRLYIETGKKRSDVSFIGYAKAFLAPYLKKYPNNYRLKMHQADILQYTHKFDEALAVLDTLTVKGSKEAKPYLLKATIYEAQGDYNSSLRMCKQLILRASHLLSTTCITTMQSQLGKLDESYLLLENVYAKARVNELSEKSWALTSLADMAYRLGKKEKALAYLEEALSINENDYFVLQKMADIHLDNRAYQKVKKLLKDYQYVEALFLREMVAKDKLGENIQVEKASLQAYLEGLSLREENAHEEDVPYFKALGLL